MLCAKCMSRVHVMAQGSDDCGCFHVDFNFKVDLKQILITHHPNHDMKFKHVASIVCAIYTIKIHSCHMAIAQCSVSNFRASEDPEDESLNEFKFWGSYIFLYIWNILRLPTLNLVDMSGFDAP